MSWLTEEEIESLPSEEYDRICYSLHGHCDEWVLDNFRDGDEINVMTYMDYDTEEEHLMHCMLIRDGKYVDVRGETDDWDKAMEGFDDWCDEAHEYSFSGLEEFKICIRRICGYEDKKWKSEDEVER